MSISLHVVLVDPIYEGNVGFTARVMKNFGFSSLIIVNGPRLGNHAIRFAMHGRDVLKGARHLSTLDDLELDYLVGTTGRTSAATKKEIRYAVSPKYLRDHITMIQGEIGLLFGREDKGLPNEVIRICDLVVTIPANPHYPILNVSHAVAIILYELTCGDWSLPKKEIATTEEKEVFLQTFSDIVERLDYDPARKRRCEIYFRRLIGRAVLTKWEFHTLMGVFRDTLKRIDAGAD